MLPSLDMVGSSPKLGPSSAATCSGWTFHHRTTILGLGLGVRPQVPAPGACAIQMTGAFVSYPLRQERGFIVSRPFPGRTPGPCIVVAPAPSAAPRLFVEVPVSGRKVQRGPPTVRAIPQGPPSRRLRARSCEHPLPCYGRWLAPSPQVAYPRGQHLARRVRGGSSWCEPLVGLVEEPHN